MFKKIILFFLLWLLLPSFSLLLAKEEVKLLLPSELGVRAKIVKGSLGEYFEKALVIETKRPRKALSTNDGYLQARLVINYSLHPEAWKRVCEEKKSGKLAGGRRHLGEVKSAYAKAYGIAPKEIALLGTAVDMDNLSVVTETFEVRDGPKIVVTALVTAGAKSNALRAGYDQGRYLEGELIDPGTINIIILTNMKLSAAALARAIITATEAKTAALQDLKVPSTYSPEVLATGTGTDSVVIVSGEKPPLITYTGGHSKMGELIGRAVYRAVREGLCKQNGFCE